MKDDEEHCGVPRRPNYPPSGRCQCIGTVCWYVARTNSCVKGVTGFSDCMEKRLRKGACPLFYSFP